MAHVSQGARPATRGRSEDRRLRAAGRRGGKAGHGSVPVLGRELNREGMIPESVLQKLDGLPAQPGVYLFKDKKGSVIYVGKAKSLRSRVRSYFHDASGDGRAFIPFLHGAVGALDTIITANEKEATILENTLIKEHLPRYNVKLRDDKDFIPLRLETFRPGQASA